MGSVKNKTTAYCQLCYSGMFFILYPLNHFMLWQGRRESSNVDDRRGIGGGGIAVGGGILGVIALVINYLLGGSGGNTQLPLPNQNQPVSAEEKAAQDEEARFVKVVLADTEDIWTQLMSKAGRSYPKPTLVLFSGSTPSGC